MSSYRLRQDQVAWMREKDCPAIDILRTAVMRYRSDDLVIPKCNQRKTAKTYYDMPLVVFPIRSRFAGIDDELMRTILDAHHSQPCRKLAARLEKATRTVDLLTRLETQRRSRVHAAERNKI